MQPLGRRKRRARDRQRKRGAARDHVFAFAAHHLDVERAHGADHRSQERDALRQRLDQRHRKLGAEKRNPQAGCSGARSDVDQPLAAGVVGQVRRVDQQQIDELFPAAGRGQIDPLVPPLDQVDPADDGVDATRPWRHARHARSAEGLQHERTNARKRAVDA